MKLIGLIGGTTWYSTLEYYRHLNQITGQLLGKSHSARLLLYSVDFEEFKPSTDLNSWTITTEKLIKIALLLQNSGAEVLALCANTTHLVANEIQQQISIPLIHIAAATAAAINSKKLNKVGLLGTKITMEQDFFKQVLMQHNIDCLVPSGDSRDFIHESILKELGRGIFTQETKAKYLEIIHQLIAEGADGIILGCTEIPLLIASNDIDIPLFDTAYLHAEAIVKYAIA